MIIQQQSTHVLATDLDGTLIPLEGNDQNRCDLETLAAQLDEHNLGLIFVTGRHFQSVSEAIEQFQLPTPQWIICDVGTSIFQRVGEDFRAVDLYQSYQAKIVASMPISELRDRLSRVDGLRLQEQVKQGRFKLSYYVEAAELNGLLNTVQQILLDTTAPYSIIHSIDPFNGDGLIDLLPTSISKSHAIAWWVEHVGLTDDAVIFAGDSGNDFAALTAGYRAIIVGNADRELAEQVAIRHQDADWTDRLYLARNSATSGVLEGCRWFRCLQSQ
jgi:HAD superfamily hydrolase (TIGR01484 family)